MTAVEYVVVAFPVGIGAFVTIGLVHWLLHRIVRRRR
jgi:hypothetical protein